ncbi:MAG: exodeoxyribonuclease VII small subunit [Spirochaetia bacterium]|nr:exodeoxyribonuclease VII small subunit [Spirochaetia bacterium]
MTKKSRVSFEEALEELETITRSLEGGNLTLEESIQAYEKGMELRKTCMEMLSVAEKRLEYLETKGAGTVERKPIEEEGEDERESRLFEDE